MNKQELAIIMVEYASRILRMSDIKVFFEPKTKFVYEDCSAAFDDKCYYITFNLDWMAAASEEQIILTAFHETRHAYQKANIDFPEYFAGKESSETIEKWRAEIESYKNPIGYSMEEYNQQSIEQDAIDFSWKVFNELMIDGEIGDDI